MRNILVAALGALAMSFGAAQAVTVDGNYDAAYGAAKSTVTYSATAPEGNFGSPTSMSNTAGYSVYLTSDGGYVYGLLVADRNVTLNFANVYFGRPVIGSTIGFEITNQRAFTPGVSGYAAAAIQYAQTANSIEFALPESYFTSPIGGLASAGFNPGDFVSLRLSQSFGYSVAGGVDYDMNTRLGAVQLSGGAAVPGPLAGAGLLPLLGLAGFVASRRRKGAVA